MASFVPINWTGHLYISVSELCLENALGLLINNTSNFREERIIVRKITATFREQRIIARKFTMNHRAKRIIIRKITRIKTIGVTKMRGNFVEISFQAKCLRKATKSQEFRRSSFALLLHNTVCANRAEWKVSKGASKLKIKVLNLAPTESPCCNFATASEEDMNFWSFMSAIWRKKESPGIRWAPFGERKARYGKYWAPFEDNKARWGIK